MIRHGLKKCPGHKWTQPYNEDGSCRKCKGYVGSVRTLPRDTVSFEVKINNGVVITAYDCWGEGEYAYRFKGDKIVPNVRPEKKVGEKT